MSTLTTLVVPVKELFVAVKFQLFRHAAIFQRLEDKLLFGRGQRVVTAAAFVVGIAAPVGHTLCHEFSVLRRVHPALEVGESPCIGHRRVVAVILAVARLTATVRVN